MRHPNVLLYAYAFIGFAGLTHADSEQCLKYEVTVDGGQVTSYRCTTSLGNDSGNNGPSSGTDDNAAASACAVTYTNAIGQCRKQKGVAYANCLNTAEGKHNECLKAANLMAVRATAWQPCKSNPACPVKGASK